jgi:hypothetical protein
LREYCPSHVFFVRFFSRKLQKFVGLRDKTTNSVAKYPKFVYPFSHRSSSGVTFGKHLNEFIVLTALFVWIFYKTWFVLLTFFFIMQLICMFYLLATSIHLHVCSVSHFWEAQYMVLPLSPLLINTWCPYQFWEAQCVEAVSSLVKVVGSTERHLVCLIFCFG